jgi:hypothetical protein
MGQLSDQLLVSVRQRNELFVESFELSSVSRFDLADPLLIELLLAYHVFLGFIPN